MATPTDFRTRFESYVEALPTIVRFLVDLLVGALVFGTLAWVSTLIQGSWKNTQEHGLDSYQVLALKYLEQLFFWLDVVVVGIYIFLRSVNHVLQLWRVETAKWRRS